MKAQADSERSSFWDLMLNMMAVVTVLRCTKPKALSGTSGADPRVASHNAHTTRQRGFKLIGAVIGAVR
jgi:hypothetical protein